MSHPKKGNIAGVFYTVEDLMALPEAGAVDPQKAREVSKERSIRFWIPKESLIAMLEHNIKVIEFNQTEQDSIEQRHSDILVAQRRLWIEYLETEETEEEDEVFVGLFPASSAGDQYDHEAAIILADEDEDPSE